MKELFDLYIAFFKIGCVNFGGGYAMLPLLEKDLVTRRGWTTMEHLRDYFAIGQCTPGIIALNVSTFIGYNKKKLPGAIAATCGFLTGPILLILIIAAFLTNFADLAIVQHAFAGIRVCVCVLIVQAVLRLWNKSVIDVLSFLIFLVIFVLNVSSRFLPWSVPAALLVIAAGIFGILFGRTEAEHRAAASEKNAKKKKEDH
ncbi:MAG: chromate transporter [Lachnospiraceae bacterium]|nr:chromate transporter [Lachnospiraceae bacterium]